MLMPWLDVNITFDFFDPNGPEHDRRPGSTSTRATDTELNHGLHQAASRLAGEGEGSSGPP